MTGLPKITDAQRVRLQPGDRLIVRVHREPDMHERARIIEQIRFWAGDPTLRVLVHGPDAEITITSAQPAGEPDENCPRSQRKDGGHAWRFDGDDPYVLCAWCDERRDALTGHVITPGSPA